MDLFRVLRTDRRGFLQHGRRRTARKARGPQGRIGLFPGNVERSEEDNAPSLRFRLDAQRAGPVRRILRTSSPKAAASTPRFWSEIISPPTLTETLQASTEGQAPVGSLLAHQIPGAVPFHTLKATKGCLSASTPRYPPKTLGPTPTAYLFRREPHGAVPLPQTRRQPHGRQRLTDGAGKDAFGRFTLMTGEHSVTP